MKAKKFLITLITGLALFGINVSLKSNTVSARPRYYSNYWYKPHKIITTRNVYAYEVKNRFLSTRRWILRRKIIKKGTHLTVTRGGSDIAPWALTGHIKGIGNAITKHKNIWTIRTKNTRWFITENEYKRKQAAKRRKKFRASFRKNTLTTPEGIMKIEGVKVRNYNHGAVVAMSGRFTNKSRKLYSAWNYYKRYFNDAFFSAPNSHRVDMDINYADGDPVDYSSTENHLLENATKYIRPGKTIEFELQDDHLEEPVKSNWHYYDSAGNPYDGHIIGFIEFPVKPNLTVYQSD